jgi:hypothetical protein
LVTAPVIVVLPELIVNGIESVSVLEICGVMRAETMAVAGFAGVASVNDPAYGPVAGPAAVKVADASPLKQIPLAPPAMNVVEVACSTSSWACAAVAAIPPLAAAMDIAVMATHIFFFPCI